LISIEATEGVTDGKDESLESKQVVSQVNFGLAMGNPGARQG
jgi:hypothetical protein